MGFSRQEYQNWLPFPPSGDLPKLGIEPVSLAAPAMQVDSLPLSHWRSPRPAVMLQNSFGQKMQKNNSGTENVDNAQAMAPHFTTLAWKNPMDGGAWWAAVHGVAKSPTRLSDFTFTFHFSCIGEGNGNPFVFLPGEFQGRGILVGCHLWGRIESDTTEAT